MKTCYSLLLNILSYKIFLFQQTIFNQIDFSLDTWVIVFWEEKLLEERKTK